MAASPRDDNRSVAIGAKSDLDNTFVVLEANPTTKALKVDIADSAGVSAIADNPEYFEDTSFVTGDSPVTLDLNAALGRNATEGFIINDGAGNFTVAFSTNGTDFGDAITMKKNEKITFTKISVDSFKITWVADSAYRVSVI